jgi:hypothetical protein
VLWGTPGALKQHHIVTSRVYNLLRNLALGQQSVHGDNPSLKDQVAQQVQGYGNLIGLVIHRLLGERHAHAVRQRREEIDARGALLLAPSQGLAIDGDSVRDRLPQEPLRPSPELGL